ncbi:MAG: aspartyl protease family protein [Planctomycetes bacterium]|nr:aspartyl protease family protein [Planctomycetota bacterium]
MGRIRLHIRVSGKKCWTLFDTGARSTYIVPEVASLLGTSMKLTKPILASFGGSVQQVKETALLEATVEKRWISTHARVVKEIGKDEEGKRIEVLIGALAMQEWGIRPIPDAEKLDLSHYTKDFVEY